MILVEGLAIQLGNFALRDVSFTIPTGEYGVLMGRTGSGKTTILEAICGLRPVEAGRIVLAGRDVTWLKPAQRGVGLVPQDGALFSSLTVREHLGFALQIRRRPAQEIAARVDELAGLLGIEHLLDRRPRGLSGGERQRVALGRALASRPPVILLDEPLSALDDATREEMYGLLRSVEERTGVTALHITHNRSEADHLADRLITLENGQAIECRDFRRRRTAGESERHRSASEEAGAER